MDGSVVESKNFLKIHPTHADKSEAICLGTLSQLRAATDTVTIAGTTLPFSEEMRSLGVIIDRRRTFESHISAVCNYHLWAL